MSNSLDKFFEEEKKKYGGGSSSSLDDFFRNESMDLGLIPDTRPKPKSQGQQMMEQQGSKVFNAFDPSNVDRMTNPPQPAQQPFTQPIEIKHNFNATRNSAVEEPWRPEWDVKPEEVDPRPDLRTDYPGGNFNPVNLFNHFKKTTPGLFMDRTVQSIGHTIGLADSQMGSPASTGNKTADAIADFAGGTAGLFVPVGGVSASKLYNLPITQTAALAAGARNGSKLGSKIASEAVREGMVGAPLAFQNAVLTGDGTVSDVTKQTLGGAATGAAGGAVMPVIGKAFSSFLSRNKAVVPEVEQRAQQIFALPPASRMEEFQARARGTVQPPGTTPIYAQGNVETLALPQGNYTRQTRLKVNGDHNQVLSNVMQKIKPEVESIITPPQRRDLLIDYVRTHLDVPVEEVWNMPIKDLQDLGQMIRQNISVYDVATNVAKRHGYDLPSLFEGKAPSVTGKLAKDAQARTYGVYPESLPNVKQPAFNKQVLGTAAMPDTKVAFKNQIGQKPAEVVAARAPQVEVTPPQRNFATPPKMNTPTAPAIKAELPKRTETPVQPLRMAEAEQHIQTNGIRERGFVSTLKESEKAPQGLKERLKAAYEPVTNQRIVSLANKRLENDLEAAASYVMEKGGFSAEKVTTAHRLIDEFSKAGNYARAADIAEKIAEEGTRAGQSIQAYSIYNRLTPEGILVHAQRIARKTNESIPVGMKEVAVTPDIAAKLTDLAQTTKAMTGIKALGDDVMQILQRAKAGEKLNEADTATLRKFVEESEQFVKEVKSKPKAPRPPRQPKDKRVRDNVVSFLDKQEEAAKARLRARGIRISSTPLDVWADYAIIGAAKMGKGTIKFAEWSAQMIQELGEEIRPHLESLYEKARETFEQSTKKVSQTLYERAKKSVTSLEKQEMDELANELADKVRSVIGKAKSGNLVDDELQEIRDLSDELADMLPEGGLLTTPDKRYLQAVKSLSKKLAGVESEKVPADQSVKEVQKLLTTISNLADEGKVRAPKVEVDPAIEDLGYQLMERTKPRFISKQEQLAERTLKKMGDSLSDAQIDAIRTLAQKVSALSGEEAMLASQDLQAVLQTLERPGILKKISTAQTIGQLLNPKTQVRNSLGNELIYRVERLNKMVATPIDIARVKLFGGQRSVTFRTHNQGQYWKNFIRGAKAGWRGVNVEGLQTQFDLHGPVFRAKWNPLTYMEKALGASLRAFDTAAYMRAVNDTLGELATLRAINEGQRGNKELIKKYIREADEHMLSIADEYGKYVTMQDNNAISMGLVKLKRGLNFGKDFGVGDLVLKYPKTPGAIVMRALEYSPAGFLRSAAIATRPLLKKDPNTREAMLALTRAMIGTFGLTGFGYFMMDQGIVTGAASKDKDIRDLQRSAGQGQYQVNLSALTRWAQNGFRKEDAKLREGDQMYTYDWMQPVSIAVSMGANIKKNMGETKRPLSGTLGAAYNSAEGGMNTLVEQSVLQGLKRAAEGYPGQTVMDKVVDILSDVPASFVPTLSNQVKQLTDNAQRETYDPDKWEQTLNKAKARIPGIAGQLPQRYDTLGKPKETYQNNSPVNVLLNPGFTSRYELSPEAKLIVDLITETGDESLAPRVPGKSLTVKGPEGNSVSQKLTGEEFARIQQLQGEETAKRLGQISPSLSTNSKVKRVQDALNTAGENARKQLKKEMGVK